MTEQNKIEQIPDKNLEKVEKPSEILQEGTFERGEISPETFAQERIETIDQEVAQLEHEGRRGIESASASVGLEPAKVQQAQKETATKGKLEQISESVQSFANDATEKIKSFFQGKKDERGQVQKETEGRKEVEVAPPPIKPGEQFFPELELKNIRSLPKNEQRQALETYKEKLAYQKEGIAMMQEGFIATIRRNPDVLVPELNANLVKWAKEYGMSNDQIRVAVNILQEYLTKHRAVREFSAKHPNDQEAFEACFGVRPHGKVELVEGPITLYFRCFDSKDYALIHSQKFLPSSETVDKKDIKNANKSAGVSIGMSRIKNLKGTIIAENQGSLDAKLDRAFSAKIFSLILGTHGDELWRGTLIHEEQHAIKRLFEEPLRREEFFDNFWQSLNKNDMDGAENALKNYLRHRREEGEVRAKDEILAYLKEGVSDSATLRTLMEKKGLYNYFKNSRKDIEDYLKGKNEMGKVFFQAFDLAKNKDLRKGILSSFKKMDKQVFEEEYKDILKSGIDSYRTLMRSGYSQDQTIALLINEPLDKWKKVVDRILEQKNKDKK